PRFRLREPLLNCWQSRVVAEEYQLKKCIADYSVAAIIQKLHQYRNRFRQGRTLEHKCVDRAQSPRRRFKFVVHQGVNDPVMQSTLPEEIRRGIANLYRARIEQ